MTDPQPPTAPSPDPAPTERLFWPAVILSGLALPSLAVYNAVTAAYHPMACAGRLLCPVMPLVLMGLATLLVLLAVLAWTRPWRRVVRRHGGAVLVAVWILLGGLSLLTTDHRETAWVGDVRHEIPWRYGPRAVEDAPGGRGFVVVLGRDGLGGTYAAPRSDPRITVSKALDPTLRLPEDGTPCTVAFDFECAVRIDGLWYSAAGRAGDLPDDPAAWLARAAKVLDAFAAPDAGTE